MSSSDILARLSGYLLHRRLLVDLEPPCTETGSSIKALAILLVLNSSLQLLYFYGFHRTEEVKSLLGGGGRGPSPPMPRACFELGFGL